MIQTYFGYGKGKTSAAVGSAIRCAGCGKKVLIVQFLKNNDSSECSVLKNINCIDIACSDVIYNLFDNKNAQSRQLFADAYDKLLSHAVCCALDKYDMLILDEVLDAVDFGYICEDKLVQYLAELKDNTEVILTGHKLSSKIADISDYISEIVSHRHPYNKGEEPREGIEY